MEFFFKMEFVLLLHTQYGCWEANLGLLQEYYALLTTEQLSFSAPIPWNCLPLYFIATCSQSQKKKKKENIKIHLVH